MQGILNRTFDSGCLRQRRPTCSSGCQSIRHQLVVNAVRTTISETSAERSALSACRFAGSHTGPVICNRLTTPAHRWPGPPDPAGTSDVHPQSRIEYGRQYQPARKLTLHKPCKFHVIARNRDDAMVMDNLYYQPRLHAPYYASMCTGARSLATCSRFESNVIREPLATSIPEQQERDPYPRRRIQQRGARRTLGILSYQNSMLAKGRNAKPENRSITLWTETEAIGLVGYSKKDMFDANRSAQTPSSRRKWCRFERCYVRVVFGMLGHCWLKLLER